MNLVRTWINYKHIDNAKIRQKRRLKIDKIDIGQKLEGISTDKFTDGGSAGIWLVEWYTNQHPLEFRQFESHVSIQAVCAPCFIQ